MIIKQSTINLITSITFLLMILLLAGSLYFEKQAIKEERNAVARQVEFKQLGIDLAHAFDYLTDEARKFAITGNVQYLQDYWQEMEVTKTRDKVLTRLQELKALPEEFELLRLAKQNYEILIATETRAMRLRLEAQAVPESSMHPTIAAWQLSAEDSKLSATDKLERARKILFDAQYHADKRIVMEPIAQFQTMMNAHTVREVVFAQRKTQTAATILLTMLILMLVSMAAVLWFFQIQFSLPIARYIRELEKHDTTVLDFALTPAGTLELRLLAKAFNRQFCLNQQQLKNNQRLITDIVQVSQGLAEGNLQVMPQAEYDGEFGQIKDALETTLLIRRQVIEDIVRLSQGLAEGNLRIMPEAEYQGDFIQIKNALEITLTSLRQVIEDIVKVSQGLASGNLHIMPAIEYQGDFKQIKNALKSTISQLAATMTKNTEQNWLKTGQTELNEKMRGEQEPIVLTQNVLNYLANYLNVQVGVCFLAQAENFRLVSSYAYKERNHNYNEFKLGEGLIGQAALEKKSILFSQIPEEHLNLSVHSGIGKSAPHNIFVLPLVYENQVLGVLELATTRHFTATELELLDQVADNIAISLNTAQSRQRMQALLEESQQLTFTLQTQQTEVTEREERIRAIVDTVMDAIITIDERGIIESFNQAAEKIFGHSKMEAIGQNVKMLMPEPYHSEHDQYLQNYFRTGESKLLGKPRELAGKRKDGTDFPIEISLAEIVMGEKYLFTGIIRDITKRKEAENVLKERQDALEQANEELQNQTEELQVQQEELRQTNEELQERTIDLEQQKKAIRDKNLALEQSQQAIETKAKELEIVSKYKSEFLACMSHELRTPLNSLLILSKLLSENKQGNLTEKQMKFTQTIHSAGSDLLTLINEILDLSKVEAGKMEIHPKDLRVKELVEALEHKFRHVAEDKGLGFQISMTPEMPTILHTDNQRFQQVINNLLSNAFKFTAKGEIRLAFRKISAQELSDANVLTDKSVVELQQIVAISVTDTGIGIPQDKQAVIFEAFQQADGSTSRRYGGTGLGLSISRQLARLLGGELTLNSETGKGSTFTLYLPEKIVYKAETLDSNDSNKTEGDNNHKAETLDSNDGDKTEALNSQENLREDDRNNLSADDKSILIMEDDRKFSNILIDLARERHFKCLVAENGKTGLQLAEEYQPNAIILDVGLPQLDGWTVMEKLKDNPQTRHIPVHFMSAQDHQSMNAKKMGAIGYLLKPVNMEELGNTFQKIEGFISQTLKNLLLVVDNQSRHKSILEIAGGEKVETTFAQTRTEAIQALQTKPFDCIVVDVEVEEGSGIQLLEQLYQADNLSQIPIILYAERELSIRENKLIQQYEDNLTIKAVRSQERLLDEATLFLHQLEAQLPPYKRSMLKMVHDKEAILIQKKVLIVDDDMRNAFALMTVLEDKEMEVIVAENGKEALEQLKKHSNTNIILMDIMMPEMDGYEAIKTIRSLSNLHHIPIIALTAKAMKGDKTKCIEAGANDYLSKPVDTDKLISLMRVWLYR